MEVTPGGLIIPKIEREHYQLGGATELLGTPLVSDGNWTPYLPVGEAQNLGVEPEACTTFGTLNAVEILIRQEFGEVDNYSDRWLAYKSGTTQFGNDPHKVAETLRLQGDVTEVEWPYTTADNTLATFYEQPPKALDPQALIFTDEFDFGHQWVNTDPQTLMAQLKYSPIGVGGFAWAQDANGLYYTPAGAQPCHWFVIINYKENEYWEVFDSYPPFVKRLRWDYQFAIAKRYTLHRQVVSQTGWEKFLAWMQVVFQQSVGLGDWHPAKLGGKERSPHWSSVRNAFIKAHPKCEVCGTKKDLEAHHEKVFHLNPADELNPANLIALCRKHHYEFGHLEDWKSWNESVRSDSALWLSKVQNRPYEQSLLP